MFSAHTGLYIGSSHMHVIGGVVQRTESCTHIQETRSLFTVKHYKLTLGINLGIDSCLTIVPYEDIHRVLRDFYQWIKMSWLNLLLMASTCQTPGCCQTLKTEKNSA